MFLQSSELLHRSTNCTPWRNAQRLPLDGDEGCLWAHRSWTGARERSCCLFCNGHVLCGKVHRWFHSSLLARLLYDRSHSDYLKATTHRIEIVCGLVDVTWRELLLYSTHVVNIETLTNNRISTIGIDWCSFRNRWQWTLLLPTSVDCTKCRTSCNGVSPPESSPLPRHSHVSGAPWWSCNVLSFAITIEQLVAKPITNRSCSFPE